MYKSKNIKIFTLSAVLLINIICTAVVTIFSIETTTLKIIGSFITIGIVGVAVWTFPLRFYISALGFVFFASSLGSCVNLYYHIGFYDRFVHYISGVLLFEGGRIVIEFVLRKRNLPYDEYVISLFSFSFSCACAAIWEIYEFACDCLINANMQGTNTNTMGDIVAGVLGALSSLVVFHIIKNFQKAG